MKSPKPVDSERVTPVQDSSILESKPLQTSSPPDPLPELADKERTELIQKFAKSVGCDQVSSTYWAFLWLQDIESLRRNVNLASISNVNAEILMQCSLFEQSQRICKLSMASTPYLSRQNANSGSLRARENKVFHRPRNFCSDPEQAEGAWRESTYTGPYRQEDCKLFDLSGTQMNRVLKPRIVHGAWRCSLCDHWKTQNPGRSHCPIRLLQVCKHQSHEEFLDYVKNVLERGKDWQVEEYGIGCKRHRDLRKFAVLE